MDPTPKPITPTIITAVHKSTKKNKTAKVITAHINPIMNIFRWPSLLVNFTQTMIPNNCPTSSDAEKYTSAIAGKPKRNGTI